MEADKPGFKRKLRRYQSAPARTSEATLAMADSQFAAVGWRKMYAWYVTYEVPRSGTAIKRRSPRSTRRFETEAQAKTFARKKFEEGLIVNAGTINPYSPRRAIASGSIPGWLEETQEGDIPDPNDSREADKT